MYDYEMIKNTRCY